MVWVWEPIHQTSYSKFIINYCSNIGFWLTDFAQQISKLNTKSTQHSGWKKNALRSFHCLQRTRLKFSSQAQNTNWWLLNYIYKKNYRCRKSTRNIDNKSILFIFHKFCQSDIMDLESTNSTNSNLAITRHDTTSINKNKLS